jgi:hypothetical protein
MNKWMHLERPSETSLPLTWLPYVLVIVGEGKIKFVNKGVNINDADTR